MTITIGTHPNNLSTWLLSHRVELQQQLDDVAGGVEWIRYTDGRETVKRFRDSTIDVGATGTTPPIIAQADGLDVAYIAISEPHPDNGGLVVPADSPLHTVADLAGRGVAFASGSWQTQALAIALDNAGLQWSDITVVDLHAIASGEDFVESGAESWFLVDPTYTQLTELVETRTLVQTAELVKNRSVFWGRGDYVRRNPDTIDAFVQALDATDQWASNNLDETIDILIHNGRGDNPETWRRALAHRGWGVHTIDDEFIAEQQAAADLFHRFGISNSAVDVRHIVRPFVSRR